MADYLRFLAFWWRGDTVQNLVSCYDVGVRKEDETVATGKRASLTAAREDPVPLCATGVRRIGPIKTSEECHGDTVQNRKSCDNEGVSMEVNVKNGMAACASLVLLRAHGARRIGPPQRGCRGR